MKLLFTLPALVLLFALSACTQMQYKELHPANAEVSALKYFKWEDGPIPSKAPRFSQFDSSFRSKISKEMSKRGYILNPEHADISISYRISVVEKVLTDTPSFESHIERNNEGQLIFHGWKDKQASSIALEHGLVIISFRSTKSKEMLWEAGASKLLESGAENVDPTKAGKVFATALAKHIPSKN